jgi:hypothetical protein
VAGREGAIGQTRRADNTCQRCDRMQMLSGSCPRRRTVQLQPDRLQSGCHLRCLRLRRGGRVRSGRVAARTPAGADHACMPGRDRGSAHGREDLAHRTRRLNHERGATGVGGATGTVGPGSGPGADGRCADDSEGVTGADAASGDVVALSAGGAAASASAAQLA